MIDHTILAPEHNERRPKVGDDVVNLVGGTCRGFRVSYVNDDCLEATTGDNPFTARIVRAIDKRGVTWDFDDPATKRPDGMELCNERVKRVEQERDSLRSQLIDAVDEARRARCKIVEHYAEVERLTKERDELAAWKAGALDVLNLWDAVAVEAFRWNAQTLCGQSKAAETIKVIRGLREEVKELARKLEGARAEVERLAAYARETYEFCASAATLESAKAEGRREALGQMAVELSCATLTWEGVAKFFKWLREKAACR